MFTRKTSIRNTPDNSSYIRVFIINYSFIIKITTNNETWDAVTIWLFNEFLFHLFSFACWRNKFLLSIFLLIAILIFLTVMTSNQTKCDIYEKTVMRAGDDERMIDYEWPNNQTSIGRRKPLQCCQWRTSSFWRWYLFLFSEC